LRERTDRRLPSHVAHVQSQTDSESTGGCEIKFDAVAASPPLATVRRRVLRPCSCRPPA
jgi:hypothetical protein